MEGAFESRPFDRRTLLVGSASVLAGAAFLGTAEAEASSGEAAWTAGIVVAPPSRGSMDVKQLPLETNHLLRVELGSGTIVHADLSDGKTILIEGDAANDSGAIAAQRVIRAVFGSRTEVER